MNDCSSGPTPRQKHKQIYYNEGKKRLQNDEVFHVHKPLPYFKHLRIEQHGVYALFLITLAVALRVILIAQGWPYLNSDEGTMGLMALHVAYHGEMPVFFYGQGYMGSLEAYLAAPLFQLFGPSAFMLRLGLLLLSPLFLVNTYLLTRTLYTKGFALFTLFLLSFGSAQLLSLQLSATGGHPDTPFFGSLLILYTLVLARTAGEIPLTRERRRRVLAYAGWGLVAGLALWTDPLLIPYIVMSGWLLLRFCRYELRRPVILFSVLGFALPIVPVIIYNLRVPLDQSTFAVIGSAIWVNGGKLEVASPLSRIFGTLFVTLPRATGGNVLCNVPDAYAWPLFAIQHAAPCTVFNGLWGGGYLCLMTIAAVLAWRTYHAMKQAAQLHLWTGVQRRETVDAFAQLMVVGSVVLTLIAYANSSAAGLDPVYANGSAAGLDSEGAARYLNGLSIAMPVILWPLWRTRQLFKPALLALSTKISRYALLLIIALSFVLGWVQTLDLIPVAQRENRHDTALVQDLLKMGVTHIYTDYWTCDRVAFESTERIICSVVDERLQYGRNRYTPYTPIVKADPKAAWVFPLDSQQAHAFAKKAFATHHPYRSRIKDGYVIYQPQIQ